MTDRPIIFSAPMVRALLDGRKTMTRRLASSPLAQAKPGDRLYVRETVACGACAPAKPSYWSPSFWRREQGSPANPSGLWYAAGGLAPDRAITDRGKWVPSIHMPRWASRLTLVVTEVRFERLQGISEEDARAEGISVLPLQDTTDPSAWWQSAPGENQARTAKESFAKLWDHLHGAGSWDENPELVSLTFEVHKRNIDQMKDAA